MLKDEQAAVLYASYAYVITFGGGEGRVQLKCRQPCCKYLC